MWVAFLLGRVKFVLIQMALACYRRTQESHRGCQIRNPDILALRPDFFLLESGHFRLKNRPWLDGNPDTPRVTEKKSDG